MMSIGYNKTIKLPAGNLIVSVAAGETDKLAADDLIKLTSVEKTFKSAFYADYREAAVAAFAHFSDDEKVFLGFNCREDEEGDRTYQCVVSNYDDLFYKAAQWCSDAVIKSALQDNYDADFTPEELFEQEDRLNDIVKI